MKHPIVDKTEKALSNLLDAFVASEPDKLQSRHRAREVLDELKAHNWGKPVEHGLGMILAISDDGAIGHQGKLPWHIGEDLKRFKALTNGHAIIMGRKTFESIGKPLPNRTHFVVSRDRAFADEMYRKYPAVGVLDSPWKALWLALETDPYPWVIGGATLYTAFLEAATRLVVTEVHREIPEADTRLILDRSDWTVNGRQRSKEQSDVEYVDYRR